MLSVLFCTYDRYETLNEAIGKLLTSRSFDPAQTEVIVVDNTPPERRRDPGLPRSVKLVTCDTPGLSHARNCGVDAASGDLIAFVDDDAFVSEDWCTALRRAFETLPGAMICGGKTVPRFAEKGKPVWYFDQLDGYVSCLDWGPVARPIRPEEWIVGTNMAVRREVFATYGKFDTSLGRKGTGSLLSNEEGDLVSRVGRAKVFYIPDMIVEHMVAPERLTTSWFRKRVFWQVVSDFIGGHEWLSSPTAEAGFREAAASLPAEYRLIDLLSFEPSSAQEFQDQLMAIYTYAHLIARGFGETSEHEARP